MVGIRLTTRAKGEGVAEEN